MNTETTHNFSLDEYNTIIEEIFETDSPTLRPVNFVLTKNILLINNPRKSNISIINMKNRILYSAAHNKGSIKINLGKLKGSYFLEIDNQKHEIYIG